MDQLQELSHSPNFSKENYAEKRDAFGEWKTQIVFGLR